MHSILKILIFFFNIHQLQACDFQLHLNEQTFTITKNGANLKQMIGIQRSKDGKLECGGVKQFPAQAGETGLLHQLAKMATLKSYGESAVNANDKGTKSLSILSPNKKCELHSFSVAESHKQAVDNNSSELFGSDGMAYMHLMAGDLTHGYEKLIKENPKLAEKKSEGQITGKVLDLVSGNIMPSLEPPSPRKLNKLNAFPKDAPINLQDLIPIDDHDANAKERLRGAITMIFAATSLAIEATTPGAPLFVAPIMNGTNALIDWIIVEETKSPDSKEHAQRFGNHAFVQAGTQLPVPYVEGCRSLLNGMLTFAKTFENRSSAESLEKMEQIIQEAVILKLASETNRIQTILTEGYKALMLDPPQLSFEEGAGIFSKMACACEASQWIDSYLETFIESQEKRQKFLKTIKEKGTLGSIAW